MPLSVPIPRNYQETDDFFVGVIVGAPKFESLQKTVKYTLTLPMMLGALQEGVQAVASRTKSESARALYAQALSSIQAAHDCFVQGNNSTGRDHIMQAHNAYRTAGKKRPTWQA